ncbi:MAG: hypothetical protein ABFD60_13485 [Bryobacteraceae bacterium]
MFSPRARALVLFPSPHAPGGPPDGAGLPWAPVLAARDGLTWDAENVLYQYQACRELPATASSSEAVQDELGHGRSAVQVPVPRQVFQDAAAGGPVSLSLEFGRAALPGPAGAVQRDAQPVGPPKEREAAADAAPGEPGRLGSPASQSRLLSPETRA